MIGEWAWPGPALCAMPTVRFSHDTPQRAHWRNGRHQPRDAGLALMSGEVPVAESVLQKARLIHGAFDAPAPQLGLSELS